MCYCSSGTPPPSDAASQPTLTPSGSGTITAGTHALAFGIVLLFSASFLPLCAGTVLEAHKEHIRKDFLIMVVF